MREYLLNVGTIFALSIFPVKARRAALVIVHVHSALINAMPTPAEDRAKPDDKKDTGVPGALFRTLCAKVKITPDTTLKMIWHHQLKMDNRV